jgi:hypothetical protein
MCQAGLCPKGLYPCLPLKEQNTRFTLREGGFKEVMDTRQKVIGALKEVHIKDEGKG